MIDHNGQADSITPDEIIGAYEIATIHNGHPGYFLCGWEDYDEGTLWFKEPSNHFFGKTEKITQA